MDSKRAWLSFSKKKGLDETSIDFLQIDSIFMPVKKVNYFVEDVRYNQDLVQERLAIEVWTNGSITPKEAISQGATIITDLFQSLKTN